MEPIQSLTSTCYDLLMEIKSVVIKGMYIVGDDTSEVLSGGAEADFLNGQGGNDTLNGAERQRSYFGRQW